MKGQTYSNQCWNNCFQDTVNDVEAVLVILTHDIGTHEGEHRHHFV